MAALMTYHWQQSVKHTQLCKVIEELPPARQAEVYDFALFLRQRDLEQAEYTISDEAALALREEFAAEDLAWAEASMTDRLSHLQKEDVT